MKEGRKVKDKVEGGEEEEEEGKEEVERKNGTRDDRYIITPKIQ